MCSTVAAVRERQSEPLPRACSDDEPFIHKWFGRDGKGLLSLAEFTRFLVNLHSIFDGLEFNLLDTDQDGFVSGLDLARSLVSPASIQYIDRLLDRVRVSSCVCMFWLQCGLVCFSPGKQDEVSVTDCLFM